MFCCFYVAKFIIDQENQILFRLLDTFYFFISSISFIVQEKRTLLVFFLCLLLLANENTDESIVPE
jgi:hypothetical protein